MRYRILHIFLAGLLWLSSTGFVLNKHYCQDILQDVAVFVKAENCHSRKAREHQDRPPSCPMHQAKSQEGHEKGCCDDTAEYLHLDEDLLKAETANLSFELPMLVAYCWSAAATQILNNMDPLSFDYLNYKPPLLVCDLSVSLQTFRL